MRFFALMILCAVLFISYAEPEPKKYKNHVKEKKTNSSLTVEERKFLREVEAKFGIKTEEESKDAVTPKVKPSNETTGLIPFPAIIAIEIVNDTDSKSKGKRTIDANLGYGYKTNNGFMYYGNSEQDKGRFVLYPYSQEDIAPPTHQNMQHGVHYQNPGPKYSSAKTHVEIQPSRAFELVAVQEEKPAYQYKKPTPNYNNGNSFVSSSPTYMHMEPTHTTPPAPPPSTLFTTYNGAGFSGLTNQFPMVMPNYFVDPSQLLKQPEYQSAGLTHDHLNSLHESKVEQRVVPVLVLRIPSSSLKNPTAELFADLPNNYPLSRYLNNVNLQELVNEYFKKLGYTFAPHVMAYKEGLPTVPNRSAAPAMSNYEPQHYAAPYVQPSYTHADYSGVQYSAVQPVMARYPSSYMRQHYFNSNGHSLYRQPMHHQKYEYRYQYVPKSVAATQTYYVHPQYHQQTHYVAVEPTESTHDLQNHANSIQDAAPEVQVQYETPSHEYTVSQTQNDDATRTEHVNYEVKEESSAAVSPEYETSSIAVPVYGSSSSKDDSQTQEYYTASQPVQEEAVAVYSHGEQSGRNYQSQSDSSATHGYSYPKPSDDGSADNGLVLSENFPSKDHTIATVLPVSYMHNAPSSGAVQTVSYVTPMPYSSKYQSPYKMMVPQTFLYSPSTEKVAYVNSQSMSSSYSHSNIHQDNNPELEYTVSQHYVPPLSRQKPPPFPRNYHSHPKRMVRPENKPANGSLNPRKLSNRSDGKSS